MRLGELAVELEGAAVERDRVGLLARVLSEDAEVVIRRGIRGIEVERAAEAILRGRRIVGLREQAAEVDPGLATLGAQPERPTVRVDRSGRVPLLELGRTLHPLLRRRGQRGHRDRRRVHAWQLVHLAAREVGGLRARRRWKRGDGRQVEWERQLTARDHLRHDRGRARARGLRGRRGCSRDREVTAARLDRELGDRDPSRQLRLELCELATHARQGHAGIDECLHGSQRGEVAKRELGGHGTWRADEPVADAAPDGRLGQADELRRVPRRVARPHGGNLHRPCSRGRGRWVGCTGSRARYPKIDNGPNSGSVALIEILRTYESRGGSRARNAVPEYHQTSAGPGLTLGVRSIGGG